uniref:WASH complex subunit 3 n=1 Tax=Calidris pygmaea TaxID=425635 RepID=A0A8C3JZ09_9CHAR
TSLWFTQCSFSTAFLLFVKRTFNHLLYSLSDIFTLYSLCYIHTHHVFSSSTFGKSFEERCFGNCESTKLSALSLRIQQIETTLNILDAKLSSIPGLEDVKCQVSSANTNSVTNGPVAQATTDQQTAVSPQSGQNNIHEEGLQKTEVVTEDVRTVAKDPRYARYLKMVQVGVPVMAIRNKMISEGLNPDLLETPDAPVPAWGDDGKTEDSSDSESSFSD